MAGAILVELAKALRVSTDELFGAKPVRETLSPKTARLLKRLRRVEELPPADQRGAEARRRHDRDSPPLHSAVTGAETHGELTRVTSLHTPIGAPPAG
jgi:hypothetical protein